MRSILNRTKSSLAELLLRRVLEIHSWSYSWAGRLAVKVGGGIHPKHGILEYEKWFADRIGSDWTVVDIGSNSGTMARAMADKASFVYGIELDKGLVERAQRMGGKNIEYYCSDATRFDYSPLRPVDCITLSNVLEHIENRVELLRILVSAVKWRNPAEKRFLVRVPMIDRDWISVYKKKVGVEYRLDRTHFIEYTRAGLENELGSAGLRILDHQVAFGESYVVAVAA